MEINLSFLQNVAIIGFCITKKNATKIPTESALKANNTHQQNYFIFGSGR